MNYNTANIEKVIQLHGELQTLLPLKDEDEQRLNKKFRLEFNYNSNHLEGNTLTYGQTQLLLIYGKSSGDVSLSDLEEMEAHDVALSQIKELAQERDRPLTEQFIKELNKTILVKPFWKDTVTPSGQPSRKKIEIGVYKTMPNSVQLKNGEIHAYASPEETPSKMHDLMNWYRENMDKLHPVHLAAEFHYRFVCIHPFDDGNGRVSRLLMNYILYKKNYPPVIIKSEDKEQYLTALQKADSGDLLAIIEYVEDQMIWSLNLNIKAAKGQDIEELADIEKEIAILKREKLTDIKIFKTPKVSFELINHVDSDLWNPLKKVLDKFDDFFAETTTDNYIDNLKVERKRTIRHPIRLADFSDREEVIKKHEIFGHDIDKSNINSVRWERKMLSLKSASEKEDYEIDCQLILKESSYFFEISERNTANKTMFKNKTTLFEQERPYKSFFMKDEVDNIVRLVSNHLIEIIKNKN
jgi:Fic family protein